MTEIDQPGGSFLIHSPEAGGVFTPEDFTDGDRAIGEVADRFLRSEVMPHITRIESGDHALMHDLMQRAGKAGLLAADIPVCYGGLGLSIPTAALIAEKLNWQQSFALTHEAHTVIGTLPLLYFGDDSLKQRYLPRLASGEWIASFALSEPNAGTDVMGMQTRARRLVDGGGFVLNGTKQWITNSAFASLFTVFARDEDERISVYLVERSSPGLSLGNEENKLGMRGTSTRRVMLDDVFVPKDNAAGQGRGHYAAFCALNLGRFKLEAGAVGGLKETLALCVQYARQRRAFGRPLARLPLVARKLGDMAAHIYALESMVYRLSGNLDRAFAGIDPQGADASDRYHRAAEEYVVECSIVKVIGSELYSRLTDEAIQIHGGYGYTEDFPVARAWRDQRLLRIGEGANEVVRVAIVRHLLKRHEQGRLRLLDAGRAFAPRLSFAPAPANTAEWSDWLCALALWLLSCAHDELGAKLETMQLEAAAIADVICCAYAVQSCILREAKLSAKSPDHAGTATTLLATVEYTTTALRRSITTAAMLSSTRPYLAQLCAVQASWLAAHVTTNGMWLAAGSEAVQSGGFPVG